MRWVLCGLVLVLMHIAVATPFIVEGHLSVLSYEVVGDTISGYLALNSEEEIGIIDGSVLVSLVASNRSQPPYGSVQEWRVAERLIPGIWAFRDSVVVPFSIDVPDFAPRGEYRLEFYAKNGRRYLGSYVPAMDTVAYIHVFVEKDAPQDVVPVIDLIGTRAEDLPAAYGPFVDKDAVSLSIVMTDPALAFSVDVTACPWDDTATRGHYPEEGCFSRSYSSKSSPLVVEFPLPHPGAFGLRVAARQSGEVTSISRLRAVRNGTSPRIATVAPIQDNGERVIVESALLPSADGSADPVLRYLLTVRAYDRTLFESAEEYTYPPPREGIDGLDRSLTLFSTVDVGNANWYQMEASILSAEGEVIDTYVRTVDFCGARGYCCHPDVPASEVRGLPPIIFD